MAYQYKVYLREYGETVWDYQGATYGLEWDISTFGLEYYTIYEWRVDTYDPDTDDTTTGDTWTFTIEQEHTFPYGRRSDYDDDKVWDPVSGTWKSDDQDLMFAGGGRYKNQLVVIGYKCLYYGEL